MPVWLAAAAKIKASSSRLDGSVVLVVIGQFDLLGEDDVDGKILSFTGLPKAFPFLAHQAAVSGVGQPHFKFGEEHNSGGAQHNQACQQAQNHEADHLPLRKQWVPVLNRLFDGQDALLLWANKFAVSFRVQAVMQLVSRLCAQACVRTGRSTGDPNKMRFARAFKASFRVFVTRPTVFTGAAGTDGDVAATQSPSVPRTATAAEAPTMVCARSTIGTWIRLTVININFTEISSEPRKTQAGGMWCKAIFVRAGSSILAGGASAQKNRGQCSTITLEPTFCKIYSDFLPNPKPPLWYTAIFISF